MDGVVCGVGEEEVPRVMERSLNVDWIHGKALWHASMIPALEGKHYNAS